MIKEKLAKWMDFECTICKKKDDIHDVASLDNIIHALLGLREAIQHENASVTINEMQIEQGVVDEVELPNGGLWVRGIKIGFNFELEYDMPHKIV